MKWNGIVSQLRQTSIAPRFAIAKTHHAASTALRGKAIAGMAHGLDRNPGAELLSHPADADVDDVGAGIEVIAPDLGEQALAADDDSGLGGEAVEDPELELGEMERDTVHARLATRQVEREPARADHAVRLGRGRAPQLHTHAREQLVERERLRHIVVRPQLESAQLRRQVAARREDHDREVRTLALELSQHGEAVPLRQ